MPNWKKVIVSGSNAHLNHVTASGHVSASSTSTGSFGRLEADAFDVTTFSSTTVETTNISGSSTSTGSFGRVHVVGNAEVDGHLNVDATLELNREPIKGFNYLARLAEGNVTASSAAHTFTVLNASKTANHPYVNIGSGQGYRIDGVESPFLYLTEGFYKFDYSGASSHPVRFYFDAAKTTQYAPSSHVSVDGNVIQLKIDKDSPQILYYQCSVHGYMGWAIHTGQNSQGQDENGMRTLFSGSAQVTHDDTTGFVANEHIDHSGVTLSAGTGLTGGGDITTNRSFAVDFSDSTLQTNISGSFTAVSSSLAARLTSEEGEAEGSVISSSAQIATDISGSFTSTSSSIASDIASNLVSINTLNGASATTGSNQFNGNQTITGSLTITGEIIAQEFKTEFISSSIIFSSGSTKFGDDITDTHEFTGSLTVSGSVSASSFNGTFDGALSSSAQIADDISGSFANPSGNVSGSATSTGSFGKLFGDASSLTNLPSAAITNYASSGDNRIITSVNSTNVQGEANLTFDGTSLTLTGQLTSSGDISGSSTSTGSFGVIEVGGGHFTSASLAAGGSGGGGSDDNLGNHTATQDLDLDDNSIKDVLHITSSGNYSSSISSTGSFGQIVVGGGVFTSASLAAGADIDSDAVSGSFNKGFEFTGAISGSSTSTGSFGLVVGDGSGLSNVAASITVKEEGTNLTTELSSINFVGDGLTATTSGNDVTVTQLLTQGAGDAAVVDVSTPSTTWAVTHSLDNRYPTVTIYDESNQVIIPESITADTKDTATITFEQAVSGKASFTLGIPTSSLFISESAQLLSEIADSTVDGDLTLTGKLTAQEIHTEIESASIIFTSGSTIFGDSIDDTHFFTGSLLISGSVDASTISGSFDKSDIKTSLPDNTVSSSAQLADDISGSLGSNASVIRTLTADAISGSFTAVSSSVASRLDSLSGDIIALSIALG